MIGDENEDHAMIAEKNVMPVTQMRIDSNLRVFEKVETPWEKTELQQFRESLGLQQIRNQVTSIIKYQCNRSGTRCLSVDLNHFLPTVIKSLLLP